MLIDLKKSPAYVQSFWVIILFQFGMVACCHLPEQGQDISQIASAVQGDQNLKETTVQRTAVLENKFYRSDYNGNILTEMSATTLNFSDQTVFLGNYIGMQGLRMYGSSQEANNALERANKGFGHIRDALVVPSSLPGQAQPNYGYFMRDNVAFNTIVIDNTTYQVNSDYQNGTDDEMSQDQLIHVLFGYDTTLRAIRARGPWPEAEKLAARIKDHADQMGLRLKAYNYIVTNPQGQAVKRGADARLMAWPLAQGIANMTGQPISRYLTQVDFGPFPAGKELVMTTSELEDLWTKILDLIYDGVCDIKVGEDQHQLCNRFDLALYNNLYLISHGYNDQACYVSRMERDGDWYRASLARLYLQQEKLPTTNLDTLQSAIGVSFATTTAPQLWCYMSRWIFFPTQCPQPSSTAYSFNGIDYLAYYNVLLHAPAIVKGHAE